MVKFAEIKTCDSILSKLSSAHDMAIKENREYLLKFVKLLNIYANKD